MTTRGPLQGGLHNCKMRLVTFDTLDWITHDLIQQIDNEKDKEHENDKEIFRKHPQKVIPDTFDL